MDAASTRPAHLWATAALIGGVAVAGCADDPATSPPVAYGCGGFALEARFAGEAVRLTLPGDKVMALPLAVSASGARYADGATTFWTKGSEAMFESRERGLIHCQARPK